MISSSSLISVAPDPIPHLWHIFQVFKRILMMFGEYVLALLDQWRSQGMDARSVPHSEHSELIATHSIKHNHIERCGCGALLVVAAHVETRGIRAPMDEIMDRAPIAVKRENNGSIFRKMFDKRIIIQAVWMLRREIECHQIDHVDDPNFEFR